VNWKEKEHTREKRREEKRRESAIWVERLG